MKKIILACDKFKGTLTAKEVCLAIKQGILLSSPHTDVLVRPMADGGDGTLDVLLDYFSASIYTFNTFDALMNPIKISFGYNAHSRCAIIESAKIIGLSLLPENQRLCMNTTSYGLGLAIKKVMCMGAKKIIIGLGGTANMDAGLGMMEALGYQFFDSNDQLMTIRGSNLRNIKRIVKKDDCLTKKVDIVCLCDVTNPFCGLRGAPQSFARQKGASSKEISILDKNFESIQNIVKETFNYNLNDCKGGGAAGGIGAIAKLFLQASLSKGIDFIIDKTDLSNAALDANLIVTGEGKVDIESMNGKVLTGIHSIAKKYSIPLAVVCGQLAINLDQISKWNIDFIAPYFISDFEQNTNITEYTKKGLCYFGYNIANTF